MSLQTVILAARLYSKRTRKKEGKIGEGGGTERVEGEGKERGEGGGKKKADDTKEKENEEEEDRSNGCCQTTVIVTFLRHGCPVIIPTSTESN